MLNDRVEPPDHALYSVELSFCYAEAAANILTNSALDPESKIPADRQSRAQLLLPLTGVDQLSERAMRSAGRKGNPRSH